MYDYNNHTEAVSVRLRAGLKDRITFHCECQRAHVEWGAQRWNRNYFINCASELLLHLRDSVRSGNLDLKDLPPCFRPYMWMLHD